MPKFPIRTPEDCINEPCQILCSGLPKDPMLTEFAKTLSDKVRNALNKESDEPVTISNVYEEITGKDKSNMTWDLIRQTTANLVGSERPRYPSLKEVVVTKK